MSVTLFMLYTAAISVLMTTIYNGSRGSIPLTFLAHGLVNDPFQLGNYPTDMPIVTAVFILIALIAVLATGHKNLGQSKWMEALPRLAVEPDRPAQIIKKLSGEPAATRLEIR